MIYNVSMYASWKSQKTRERVKRKIEDMMAEIFPNFI